MVTLNFKHASWRAFWQGFLKGMAAPVMLFDFESRTPRFTFEPVQRKTLSVEEALASDWMRIGNEMRAQMKKLAPSFDDK
jgi:hypothetical protein